MQVYDPYSFEPLMSDLDLFLFGEGNHSRIYERLGAHEREIDGIKGVNFAVWAPNAKGSASWQFQRMGWPPTSDAKADSQRRLGNVHARNRTGHL